MKDYVGDMWDWENLIPHLEDEFRSKTGVFEDMAEEFEWKPEYRFPNGMAGTPAYYEAAHAWSAKQLEGLASLQLGEHSVQFDEESGELLIAGPGGQLLLSGDEAHRLCDFLVGLRAGNAIDYSELPF